MKKNDVDEEEREEETKCYYYAHISLQKEEDGKLPKKNNFFKMKHNCRGKKIRYK